MREHKYRAWFDGKDIKVKQFVIRDGNSITETVTKKTKKGMVQIDLSEQYHDTTEWYRCKKYAKAIMQYTGLKDKNDVEIYEGDIIDVKGCGANSVQCSQGEYWLGLGMEKMKYLNGEYVDSCVLRDWGGGCFCEGLWCGNKDCKNPLKIIGNIYENPELIK